VVGGGTIRRWSTGSGETWESGWRPQESEPSWYRSWLWPAATGPMLWHRRETRRPTENTNRSLRWQGRQQRKSAGRKPVPRDGG